MNPLRTVADLGQSIWLDYIRRDLLLTGGLHRLVEEDGLGGVTSNPAIFEKAIATSPLRMSVSASGPAEVCAPAGRGQATAVRPAVAPARISRRVSSAPIEPP